MNVFVYSYPCISLGSVNGTQRSVSLNVYEFFDTRLQWVCFVTCDPNFYIYPALFCYLKGLLFLLILIVCLGGKEFFFINDSQSWCCYLNVCCFILRPLFSITLSSTPERKTAAALTDPAMFTALQFNCNTIANAPERHERQWNRFRLMETGDWFVINQTNCRFCGLRQSVSKLENRHLDRWNILRVDGQFELLGGKIFDPKGSQALKFFFLIGSFDLAHPLSWGHT